MLLNVIAQYISTDVLALQRLDLIEIDSWIDLIILTCTLSRNVMVWHHLIHMSQNNYGIYYMCCVRLKFWGRQQEMLSIIYKQLLYLTMWIYLTLCRRFQLTNFSVSLKAVNYEVCDSIGQPDRQYADTLEWPPSELLNNYVWQHPAIRYLCAVICLLIDTTKMNEWINV